MSPQLRLELDQQLASMHPNLRAWADMVGTAEGTVSNPLTQDGGYDVIVNSLDADGKLVHEIFTDYSTHPFCAKPPRRPLVVNAHGLRSDAAGKFQIMARFWPPYKLQLRLPDFGPASQIKVMVQMVKECRAIDDILTGHLTVAIAKCSSRWASLPGNDYKQPKVQLAVLEEIYERHGGNFA